jgi:type VI secretion system protein ImpA
MAIDIDKLLSPLSAEQPEGEDLEYAPEFLELDTLSKGKPEEEIGGVFKPAEEPEWKEVRKRALELAGRTRDLRVGILLTIGLLQSDGFAGFADGVTVLHGTLEKFWDTCYPKLDPDDDNDPTMRLNALSALAPMDAYGDPFKFRTRLSETPIASSRRLGRFSLKDMQIASGQLAFQSRDPNAKPPEAAVVKAALEETELAELQAILAAAEPALGHLQDMDALITEKAGAGRGPNLKELNQVLKDVIRTVGEHIAQRTGTAAAGGAAADGAAPGEADGGKSGGGAAISGEIRSRDDAIRMMDKICEYFARHEPSSPVPLLVNRARRLTRLNFMDLIRDLSPEAIEKIKVISGPTEEELAASKEPSGG